MIKNVVFDCGQVLVHFEPAYIVRENVGDSPDAPLLTEVVFDRLYWDRLDAGTLTSEEALAAMRTRLPEGLWGVAEQIYYSWIYNIPEMEGMRELILHIKERFGARVYLLSNISRYFAAHAEEIPILQLLDRCIFSSVCGRMKPDRAIFEYLCAECALRPEETVFVDDRADNVASAESIGIHGYVFDGDAARLRAYLNTLFT